MKEWNKIFFWIKKRSKTDWLVIGLIGMLLVIFAIPTKEKATKEDGFGLNYESIRSGDEKVVALEIQLEEMLKKVNGVGDVEVMITMEESNTSYFQMEDKGNQVKGVLIVAEGISDAKVQTEIYEAVMALFGIDMHKIKIIEMSK